MVKDWIEHYVYAVGEKLPGGQRADIEKELHSLILDAVDEKAATRQEEYGPSYKASEADVIEVLESFGSPQEVAANYLPRRSYLIGPELFYTYTLVLKIVLAAVFIGLSVATLVSIIFAGGPILESLLRLPLQFISGAISAVGTITIIFALIQHFGSEAELTNALRQDEWHVRDLPAVPLPANRLKRSGVIAEICFLVVVIALVNLFLDRFAIFYLAEGETIFVPLFNLDVVKAYIPYFNVILLLSLILSVYKLKLGQWNTMTRVGSVVLSLAGVLVFIFFATNQAIFNPELGESLLALTYLGLRFVIAVVIITTAYEIISHIVSMFKNLGQLDS